MPGDPNDILSGAPDSGGSSNPSQSGAFLGVNKDYVRPVPQTSLAGHAYDMQGMVGLTPLYRSEDVNNRLAQLSVEDLARLQGQMASVGLIGPSTRFRVGLADGPTVSAYRSLLTLANHYGWTDTDALSALSQQGGITGSDVTVDANGNLVAAHTGPSSRTTKQKSITEPVYTDPATARDAMRNVWQTNFGREPTEGELSRYAHRLRVAESGADVSTTSTTTQYDASGAATGSTSHTTHQDDSTDPTAQTVADQMSRTGKLGRERNTRLAGVDYYGAILQLPGMNPGG